MRCPKYNLINPDTALRCDCGYDFRSGQIERPYVTTAETRRSSSPIKSAGALYVLLAFLIAPVAFLWLIGLQGMGSGGGPISFFPDGLLGPPVLMLMIGIGILGQVRAARRCGLWLPVPFAICGLISLILQEGGKGSIILSFVAGFGGMSLFGLISIIPAALLYFEKKKRSGT